MLNIILFYCEIINCDYYANSQMVSLLQWMDNKCLPKAAKINFYN